jgi:ABC-2 type transport system permease protein
VNPRVSAVEQIARTELRRYVQDRVAIFTLVLMPLLIVFLIGSAYGSASTVFVVGVVDADDTDSSADLVAALEASNTVATRDYSDEADLRRDIRLGDVAGGLLIPAGYGRDVAAGSAVALPVVTLQADQGSTAVVAAVTGALAGEGAVLAAARFVAGDGSVDPESAVQVARAVAPSVDLPEIDVQTVGTIRPED